MLIWLGRSTKRVDALALELIPKAVRPMTVLVQDGRHTLFKTIAAIPVFSSGKNLA